jgi:peptidoglycan/LPS O-acetylase OafA/YrhL
MADTSPPGQTGTTPSRANLSLGFGIAAIAGFILAIVATGSDEQPEWLWLISPLLGLGALAAGLTAREGGRFPARAVIGMVIGALALLNLIGWTIADIAG